MDCEVDNGGCHVFATCTKTAPNRLTCSCKSGYQGDGYYCQMIDSCASDNGGCGENATCLFTAPVSTHKPHLWRHSSCCLIFWLKLFAPAPSHTAALTLLTPISDRDRISPYNINTISSRQVMRIKKNINKGIISWSNIKFPKRTSRELYGRQ